jgi:hypothetical protein
MVGRPVRAGAWGVEGSIPVRLRTHAGQRAWIAHRQRPGICAALAQIAVHHWHEEGWGRQGPTA